MFSAPIVIVIAKAVCNRDKHSISIVINACALIAMVKFAFRAIVMFIATVIAVALTMAIVIALAIRTVTAIII